MINDEVDRDSYVTEKEELVTDPDQVARIESENGILQFDSVVERITTALRNKKQYRLRPSVMMELNRLAIQRIHKSAGSFRSGQVGIRGSSHVPPGHEQVPELVEDLCDYVNDNWEKSAVHLTAYILWRINWIHPFVNGNGRTARALSYMILNIRLGCLLPGSNTIPEQIATNKSPYYSALEAADAACKEDRIDVSALEALLADLLAHQFAAVHQAATTVDDA